MKIDLRTIFANLIIFPVILAHAAPNADVTLLRQQWPWTQNIEIQFNVTGLRAPGAYRYTVCAYSGETLLGVVPHRAFADMGLVEQNGLYSTEFDPAKTPFLVDCEPIDNFRVTVSVSDDAVLYAVIDLAKNAADEEQLTLITSSELKSGAFGAWTMGSTFHTGPLVDARWQDTPVWTGVTNDHAYATTKLVMRHIPAGTFTMGSPADELFRAAAYESQREVTVTKGFFIGVFELTSGQYASFVNQPSASRKPQYGVSYDSYRGSVSNNICWPSTGAAVNPASTIATMRTKTALHLDMPTSAQWEYACRAGTTGAWNNGATATNSETLGTDAELLKLGWYRNSSGGDASSWSNVGLKLPNAWGLYDCHGNVAELCLDWIGATSHYTPDRVGERGDSGPEVADAYSRRIERGGTWTGGGPGTLRTARLSCGQSHLASNGAGLRLVLMPF